MNEEILKRLEEIEARAARATPGRWESQERQLVLFVGNDTKIVCQCHPWPITDEVWEQAKTDMIFIAHSREDVPWLCQVARELLAQNAAMRAALERIEELLWEAYSQQGGGILGEGEWLRTGLQEGEEALKHVMEVLGSDVGRDLLDRLHKLERVAEAAQEYLAARELYLTTGKLPDGFEEGDDPTWKLRKALSVLEEENDGNL